MYVVVLFVCNKHEPKIVFVHNDLRVIAKLFADNFDKNDIDFMDDEDDKNTFFAQMAESGSDDDYFVNFGINIQKRNKTKNIPIVQKLFNIIGMDESNMFACPHIDLNFIVAKTKNGQLGEIMKEAIENNV